MKEYIEKAAVKDEILSWAVCINHPELLSKKDTMYCIDNMPSANVAEVVRCRECKRWDTDADSYGKDDGPKGTCMKFFEDTYSDDYCSYGQRKEADHDVSKNH